MKKILIILLMSVPITAVYAEEWKNKKIENYDLSWRFVGNDIEVSLSSAVNGWISVGFDAESKMRGANVIIGTVKDGELTIEDHFGDGNFRHTKDEKLGGRNDITAAEGYEENGITTIKFKIPADSGDEYDKPLKEGETYRIIFASSNSDNIGRKHSRRVGADIRL